MPCLVEEVRACLDPPYIIGALASGLPRLGGDWRGERALALLLRRPYFVPRGRKPCSLYLRRCVRGFPYLRYLSNPRQCPSRVRRTPTAWRRSWPARIRERSAGRSRLPWWNKNQVSKCPPPYSVRRGLASDVAARRNQATKESRRCQTAVPFARAENRHGTPRTVRRGGSWHDGGSMTRTRRQPTSTVQKARLNNVHVHVECSGFRFSVSYRRRRGAPLEEI